MPTTIIMPQLGESVAEGVIGKWLKQEGDQIGKDEPLVEVITDKVNAEIPSPVAGTLEKIIEAEGATVAVGQEIAVIGDGQQAQRSPQESSQQSGNGQSAASQTVAPEPVAAQPSADQGPQMPRQAQQVSANPAQDEVRADRVRSSPLVRRLADQYGINLAAVPGTGIGGRVSKHDIMSFIEQKGQTAGTATAVLEREERPAPQEASSAVVAEPRSAREPAPEQVSAPAPQTVPRLPQPPSTRPVGPNEELIPVSPLRKMIAERMVQSVYTIPHATTMVEVDMSGVVRYRAARKDEFQQREGVPLSFVAFVIKATVAALKTYPLVNSEWAHENIILKKELNINVAVDAPEGLITPVIHHADDKSLAGLSRAISDLATRAHDKKLTVQDMQGGTFTVNNTGALGSVAGVSIINYPQAAILSAAAIVKRPAVIEQDGQDLIAVRSIMNLILTFDHRVLDGGSASAFLNAVKGSLESWPMDYSMY